jgi:hypothetical protein
LTFSFFASFPNNRKQLRIGSVSFPRRIEHWDNAVKQGPSQGHAIDAAGSIFDWLVVMHRLDDRQRPEHMPRSGGAFATTSGVVVVLLARST